MVIQMTHYITKYKNMDYFGYSSQVWVLPYFGTKAGFDESLILTDFFYKIFRKIIIFWRIFVNLRTLNEGTRVYVRLSTHHAGTVCGHCGNYDTQARL